MKTKSLLILSLSLLAVVAVIASCDRKSSISVGLEKGDQQEEDSKPAITVADYATDPGINASTREFLKLLNSGGKPLEELSKEDERNVLINAQAGVKVDYSGIEESQKTINQDNLSVSLNIVRPKDIKGNLPVFMFVHGGGWILGDYPTHKRLVRDLVVLPGCVAVFVNYTPSPEAHYPVAVNEIYAATKWVAQNGSDIKVDGSRLAIVGNSAGGNMAAATALLAKEKNGPKISFVNLLWPVTDVGFDTESYQKLPAIDFLQHQL